MSSKLYLLTEPGGRILKVNAFTGFMDNLGDKGHGVNIVLNQLYEKTDNFVSLYIGNFYNSFLLSKKLYELYTCITGMFFSNMKEIPSESDFSRVKLKIIESMFQYLQEIGLSKWCDLMEVLCMSIE